MGLVNSKKEGEEYANELFLLVKDEVAVKYLQVFRNEIRIWLKQNDFFSEVRGEEKAQIDQKAHGEEITSYQVVRHLLEEQGEAPKPKKKAKPS